MNQLHEVYRNMMNIKDILTNAQNEDDVHEKLDRIIESVKILYDSKRDFEENYPDKNDIAGKINLIVNRRF